MSVESLSPIHLKILISLICALIGVPNCSLIHSHLDVTTTRYLLWNAMWFHLEGPSLLTFAETVAYLDGSFASLTVKDTSVILSTTSKVYSNSGMNLKPPLILLCTALIWATPPLTVTAGFLFLKILNSNPCLHTPSLPAVQFNCQASNWLPWSRPSQRVRTCIESSMWMKRHRPVMRSFGGNSCTVIK